jgi:integrase
MPVDDLWFLSKRGTDGERLPSKRHGRGKRWRCRWVDDTGQPKQLLFERKADADRHDANVRADLSRGRYIDPGAGTTTVTQFAREWREVLPHRGSTAARVETALRLHVEPAIGRMQLAQVRPSHIKALVKALGSVLAPATVHVVYGYVASMFSAAVLDRRIGATPCVGITLPDLGRGERFIPGAAQVHALADAMAGATEGRYEALVYLGAGCGPRQGEAFGLEVEHINFLGREITIKQQLVTATGRKPFLAPVKTPTSNRTVELGQVVAEALAEHLRRFPPVPVEIDDETDPRKPVRRLARLVFTNGNGDPIRRGSWPSVWVPRVKAAGLPEGFGYHGLRHHYATLLIHGGASVKTVQMALGHANPTITLNEYAGEWPDALDRTRNLVDAALSRRPVLAVAR